MVFDQNITGRGWHGNPKGHARAGSKSSGFKGDPEAHAKAGRKGGRSQGRVNNPGNFANNRQKAREAGKKGGSR